MEKSKQPLSVSAFELGSSSSKQWPGHIFASFGTAPLHCGVQNKFKFITLGMGSFIDRPMLQCNI
jgi:hypothetical protein